MYPKQNQFKTLCIGEKVLQFKNKFQNVETAYFSQNYLIQKELFPAKEIAIHSKK